MLVLPNEQFEGGYSAECLSENIHTQGETWEELRANVKEATEAYFYDGPSRNISVYIWLEMKF